MIFAYQERDVYGNTLLYPVGANATKLCSLFGTKTITPLMEGVVALCKGEWVKIPRGMVQCGACERARFDMLAKCTHCGD